MTSQVPGVAVISRAERGIDAPEVVIETRLSAGLPGFALVGLPEAAVREARERVKGAIQASRFAFPRGKITVNLAPADLPKEGGRFDLGIALGILARTGALPAERLARFEVIGELGLYGELRPVRGALRRRSLPAKPGAASSCRYKTVSEVALARGVDTRAVAHLDDACALLKSPDSDIGRTTQNAPMPVPTTLRSRRRQRPTGGETRADDRRSGRTPSVADGSPGHRQDDARGASRQPAAAVDRERCARGRTHPLGIRQLRSAVPIRCAPAARAAPHRVGGRAGRRRRADAAAGRDFARASRRVVPRRIARVRSPRARVAAATARRRRDRTVAGRREKSAIRRASSWSRR